VLDEAHGAEAVLRVQKRDEQNLEVT